jgi:methyl-accepting chemotaxis protein
MAAMLKNTEETNAITVRTGKDVEHQSEVMAASIAAMEEIESSTQKIGSIVGMIDEIAFQTNLLALNAGVEAARAGSQGAGFGFIANEVRELAQRSGNFARDIRALIADSSTQATRGVELVTDAGKSLDRISVGVREIGEHMGVLANEVRSSAGGIGQINVALGEIDTVTQQNAAMAEEQTAATHSMMGETNRLAQIADGFRTNAGGGGGGGERRLYAAGGRR